MQGPTTVPQSKFQNLHFYYYIVDTHTHTNTHTHTHKRTHMASPPMHVAVYWGSNQHAVRRTTT